MAKKAADRKKTAPKRKVLTEMEATIAAVRKKYGDSSLMRLNEKRIQRVDVIPSGSYALDRALGIGGWPRGRIIEIFGHESGGKTTLALHAMAEAQRGGGLVSFVDAEHALDPTYARALGVKVDDLLLSQPDSGEQALEIADTLISTGNIILCVVDSVAALTPQAELDGEMGDTHMGLQARMMGQAMRKLTAKANRTNTAVIFINQIRHKIGVMFGSPETTPGGNALKFYASVRADIRRRSQIKEKGNDDPIGNEHIVKVKKNKLAPPFKKAEFEIVYGQGIDKFGDLLNMAVELEIIEQNGSWYNFNGERLCQGRFTLRDLLVNDPSLHAEIESRVIQQRVTV